MAPSLAFLFLSVNFLPYAAFASASTHGALNIRDVIPSDLMDAYGGYELVHLEERDGEDVVCTLRQVPHVDRKPKLFVVSC